MPKITIPPGKQMPRTIRLTSFDEKDALIVEAGPAYWVYYAETDPETFKQLAKLLDFDITVEE